MDYVHTAQLKINNMLYPRLTNCPECANIPELLKRIDCRLAELGNNLYNNISYMLNQPVPAGDMLQLIAYKRILMYKNINPDYVYHYSISKIASKVILLTLGCESKSMYTPTVRVTTTTTTTPCPTTTTTTTTAIITTTTTTTLCTSRPAEVIFVYLYHSYSYSSGPVTSFIGSEAEACLAASFSSDMSYVYYSSINEALALAVGNTVYLGGGTSCNLVADGYYITNLETSEITHIVNGIIISISNCVTTTTTTTLI